MMRPRTPEETMRNLRFADGGDLEVFIRRELLEYLLQLAKNAYPNEFMGFLRERDGVFEEVLIIPGHYGRDSVFFNPWLLPHDENVKETVHSHPSANPLPSKADLDFFEVWWSSFDNLLSVYGVYSCGIFLQRAHQFL